MEGPLTVYMFNVGQGDHLLLKLPNGEYGIIDFFYENRLDLKEPPALSYLNWLRRKNPDKPITLSFICLSHPDYDHVRGVAGFLEWITENNVPLKRFWMYAGTGFTELVKGLQQVCREMSPDKEELFKITKFSKELKAIDQFLKRWDGHPEHLQDIRKLADITDETEAVVIAPLDRHIRQFDEQALKDFCRFILSRIISASAKSQTKSAEANMVSSILMITFKHYCLLFGGDTGKNIWKECLDHYDNTGQSKAHGPVKADFVKASHHGSRNSSSVALWERILGQEAAVGISAGRKYHHPHRETLADIQKASSRLKTATRIFPTNICSDCLQSLGLREERLSGPDEDPLKPETREVLKRIRPRSAPARPAEPLLPSFIFRFDLHKSDVEVAVSGMRPTADKCGLCSP